MAVLGTASGRAMRIRSNGLRFHQAVPQVLVVLRRKVEIPPVPIALANNVSSRPCLQECKRC